MALPWERDQQDESWSDREAWRGDEHVDDVESWRNGRVSGSVLEVEESPGVADPVQEEEGWPEELAGPEYWLFKKYGI